MPTPITTATPRPRRQCIPVIHDAAPTPVIDDERDVVAVPPCARAVGVEAYRRQVDAMTLDPSHGIAQAVAIDAAAARERHLAALIADAQRDGATTPEAIAAWLVRRGVGVRL